MCQLCKNTQTHTAYNQETGLPQRVRCECAQLADLQAQYDRLQEAIAATPPADRGGLYWAAGYVATEISYLQAVLQ